VVIGRKKRKQEKKLLSRDRPGIFDDMVGKNMSFLFDLFVVSKTSTATKRRHFRLHKISLYQPSEPFRGKIPTSLSIYLHKASFKQKGKEQTAQNNALMPGFCLLELDTTDYL
jgi:hypothetical protein